jgi:hypothetical protein
MIRILMAGVVGCWAAAADDREDLVRKDDVTLARVAVVHGSLRVGKGERDMSVWRFRKTPRGVLIYLAPGERSGGWGGWYLNYDHRGKDRRLGLVPRPGRGCYWTWSEGPWRRNVGGFGYTFPCTARAANGPLRGWSLAFEGARLVLGRTADPVTFEGAVDDLNDGK